MGAHRLRARRGTDGAVAMASALATGEGGFRAILPLGGKIVGQIGHSPFGRMEKKYDLSGVFRLRILPKNNYRYDGC